MKDSVNLAELFILFIVIACAAFFTMNIFSNEIGSFFQKKSIEAAEREPKEEIGPYTVEGSINCTTCNSKQCVNKIDLLTYIAPDMEGEPKGKKEKIVAGPLYIAGESLLTAPHALNFQFKTVYLNDLNPNYKVWTIGVLRSTEDKGCNYQIKVGSANFKFSDNSETIDVGEIQLRP